MWSIACKSTQISIHAPRTGSDSNRCYSVRAFLISIHAPRTGSDRFWRVYFYDFDISIHAPRTGSDADFRTDRHCAEGFQSTLPARGATFRFRLHDSGKQFQSTLPARGATGWSILSAIISVFQSTLPARGATRRCADYRVVRRISIHAPRTGSDLTLAYIDRKIFCISIHAPRTGSDSCFPILTRSGNNFNPRSPHGERRDSVSRRRTLRVFQSTLPARGATKPYFVYQNHVVISIHAPRTGSDAIAERETSVATISIHAPRTGSDFAPCG